MSDSCVFCRIFKGEIPSRRIFEDDHAYAFLDIEPAEEGHTLVIPKFHAATLFELPPEELAGMMPAVHRVAMMLRHRLACHGMNLLQSNGACALQTVGHVHFHLIPRWENRAVTWHANREAAAPEQLDALHKKIIG